MTTRAGSQIGSCTDLPITAVEIDDMPWPTPERPMPVEEDDE